MRDASFYFLGGSMGDMGDESKRGSFYFSASSTTVFHTFKVRQRLSEPKRPSDRPAFDLIGWKEGVLAKLPVPPAPFGLQIQSQSPTMDPALSELARFKTLEILVIEGRQSTNVTDTGLKKLAALPGLQTLQLDGLNLTITGTGLAELKSLQRLYLWATKVNDESVKTLAGLKGLQILDLSSTQVTDAGLKELRGLTNLQRLFLGGTDVTGTGFKDLGALTDLQTLNLEQAKVTDAGLRELAGLKGLRYLDLGKTQVTDEGVKNLAALKSLRWLILIDTQVTDAGLESLASLENLEYVDPSRTKATMAGKMKLRKALPDCTVCGSGP
jgi:hypothetical protein